jgi:hypothetical protein
MRQRLCTCQDEKGPREDPAYARGDEYPHLSLPTVSIPQALPKGIRSLTQ